MMSTTSILLQGGTLLVHNLDDTVTPLEHTDLLIEGNTITQIGPAINPPSSARIVNCHGKILTPGFIDTHHHLWQTQLKGRFNNDTLLDYMPRGNMASYAFSPSDLYIGQLTGCLEALDAGTTTVVDHAHGAYSAEHATQAIDATVDSGLRCFYCYSYVLRIDKWDMEQCVPNQDIMAEWATAQIEALAKDQSWGNGRVSLGFGFDFFFLPREVVVSLFSRIRALGIKLITIHVAKNAIFGRSSTIDMLKEYGLLGRDILVSHGTCLEEHEYKILKDAGVYISSTPDTEAQMGMSAPVCFNEGVNGCLGVDCHANNSSFMLDQARTGLLLKRAQHNDELIGKGKYPRVLPGDAVQAFNLATTQGAKACGMEKEIGSLAVGKKAYIVVFDAEGSPSMLGAAEHDPVVAVVRFSGVRDIECVIVDGVIRKERGMLVDIDMKGTKTPWRDVAKGLRRSREEIQKRLDGLDVQKGKEMLINIWYIDRDDLV